MMRGRIRRNPYRRWLLRWTSSNIGRSGIPLRVRLVLLGSGRLLLLLLMRWRGRWLGMKRVTRTRRTGNGTSGRRLLRIGGTGWARRYTNCTAANRRILQQKKIKKRKVRRRVSKKYFCKLIFKNILVKFNPSVTISLSERPGHFLSIRFLTRSARIQSHRPVFFLFFFSNTFSTLNISDHTAVSQIGFKNKPVCETVV